MTTEDSSATSSASECSEKIEAIKTASDLLAQGTRSMVCGEIPKAVNLYEEAVQLLVKSCGELSRDCADAYYCCGSALLELGRMESSVLGVALEGVDVEEEKDEEVSEQFEKPPEDEGEERQKLREEVYEAMAEGEREEELKKTVQEESKESSTQQIVTDKCDKSEEVTDMETDAVCEKTDNIAVEKTAVALEQSSNTAGSNGDEAMESASSDSQKENKTEASVSDVSGKTADQETVHSSAAVEGNQEEQMDESVAEAEKNTSTSETQKNISALADEEKTDTVAVEATKVNTTCAEGENISTAGQEGENINTAGQEGENINLAGQEGENINIAGQEGESINIAGQEGENSTATNDESKKKVDDIVAEIGEKQESSIKEGENSTSDIDKSDKEKTNDNVAEIADKQDSASGQEVENSTANNDESKTDEKIDDSATEIGEKQDSSVQEGKHDNITGNDESKKEDKMDDSVAETTEIQSSACDKEAENVHDSVSGEHKQEEKITDSPAENVTGEHSTLVSTQENISISHSDESKQEQIDNSTVKNGKVTEEHSSNENLGETISTSDIDNSKEVKKDQDQQIESNSNNVDKDKNIDNCGEQEGCKKIEDKEKLSCAEEQDTSNKDVCGDNNKVITDDDKAEKVISGGDTKVQEIASSTDADIEMAEDDGEDEDDEDVDAEDDVQDGDKNGDEKEEDIPNFQLAWEYLDLAKVIYLRSDTADDQLKAALCHVKLGELSMETEQHATAVEDLENAYKIQQKYLPANDRQIAETYYQLGLAYGFSGEYEKSVHHYGEAIKVIESKIESLRELVKEKGVNGEDKENIELDQCKKYEDEIQELLQLIPEIKNKIEDTNQEVKEMEELKHMAKEALASSALTKENGSSPKATETAMTDNSGDLDDNVEKVSDIAHLVRKKRKPDSDLLDTDALEPKKIRPDGDYDATLKPETEVNGISQQDAKVVDDGCCLIQNEDMAVAAEPAAS